MNNIFAQRHPSVKSYLADHYEAKRTIYDRGEIRRISRALSLSPEDLRGELRRLGYIKTKNDHGIAIWQKQQEGAEWLC